MNQPLAIVIAAAILAGSALFLFRYELGEHGGSSTAHRLNRLTGQVELCVFDREAKALVCGR